MLEFGKALDVGIKRQDNKNQDALKIVRPWFKLPLLIIADGMGGYRGGSEASKIVIKTLSGAYRRAKKHDPIEEVLVTSILDAHQKIIKRSKTSDALSKMGSTVVCAVVDKKNGEIIVANVGDTRVYLISHKEISQISYDHSEVAELERKGVLNKTEAQNYIRKNVLTMSLAAHRPAETIQPYIKRLPFPEETLVLLCSDGLWNSVPGNLIRLTALEYAPQEAAQRLVALANTSGGPDNISIIIARRKGEWQEYAQRFAISLEETQQ